jgi:hypothetical protein
VRNGRSQFLSFPRRRESTLQAIENMTTTDWIPAFAGMTGVMKVIPFQMTPVPLRERGFHVYAGVCVAFSGSRISGQVFAGMRGNRPTSSFSTERHKFLRNALHRRSMTRAVQNVINPMWIDP